MARPSGRAPDQLRHVSFERRHAKHAEGAVLVAFGDTQVLCTASVEDTVPPFLRGKGKGWVTAEYGMLPPSPPPLHSHALPARGFPRQAEWSDPRDPAPHRPLVARGRRSAGARGAHRDDRL